MKYIITALFAASLTGCIAVGEPPIYNPCTSTLCPGTSTDPTPTTVPTSTTQTASCGDSTCSADGTSTQQP